MRTTSLRLMTFGIILLLGAALWAPAQDKTFTFTEVPIVQVKTILGDIHVVAGGQAGKVTVRTQTRGDGVQPVIEQKGNILTISEKLLNPAHVLAFAALFVVLCGLYLHYSTEFGVCQYPRITEIGGNPSPTAAQPAPEFRY